VVRWSAFQTGLRDVVQVTTGAYMLYTQTQAPPERVNFFIIGFGALLLAAPGLIGAFVLSRGNDETRDTPSPPSHSRRQPSSRR
jgi:hypothetical protein